MAPTSGKTLDPYDVQPSGVIPKIAHTGIVLAVLLCITLLPGQQQKRFPAQEFHGKFPLQALASIPLTSSQAGRTILHLLTGSYYV